MRVMRFRVAVFVVVTGCVGVNETYAQLNQATSGTTSGTTSTTTFGSTTNSGTSTANSGTTTSGQQFGPGMGGPTPGGNAVDSFIGGNALEAFIGSGLETQRNRIRQFRAFANMAVPKGETQPKNNKPRRIPAALRIAFQHPSAESARLSNGSADPVLGRALQTKAELRDVKVTVQHNGVVVLTGVVPTAAASRLATNLLRLSPGVRTVDNQLNISGP